MTTPVLSVRDLSVEIPTRAGIVKPVDGVSYDIGKGEILGVVGESGAGKSMAGNAVIGLLSPPAHISGGEIWLNGNRIDHLAGRGDAPVARQGHRDGVSGPADLAQPFADHRRPAGRDDADPPAHRAARGRETARYRRAGGGRHSRCAAERIDSYPHEFSGGMRQRVVIALALCAEPSLIIADEPTTALDVSVQAQIIALLRRLCRERGTAVMLITHDMGVIAEAADRVAVMYAGRLAELGTVRDVLTRPAAPLYRRADGLDPAGRRRARPGCTRSPAPCRA